MYGLWEVTHVRFTDLVLGARNHRECRGCFGPSGYHSTRGPAGTATLQTQNVSAPDSNANANVN